jgi:hypothetical protein
VIAAILAQAGVFWHLPVMVILVSLVYSATRFDEWDRILNYAIRVGLLYIVVFMAAVFLVLWLLSSVLPKIL